MGHDVWYSSEIIRWMGRPVTVSLAKVSAFIAVNLLLVAACLLALRQNVNLRAEAASVEAMLTLANGTVVPPLAGKDWTGAQQVINYDHDLRPTLVYTFSTRCPIVERTGVRCVGCKRWRLVGFGSSTSTATEMI